LPLQLRCDQLDSGWFIDDDEAIRSQIVRERCRPVNEVRREEVKGRRSLSRLQHLNRPGPLGADLGTQPVQTQLAQLGAGFPDAFQGELSGRQEAYLAQPLVGSLRVRIEGADGIDLVAKKINADRQVSPRREEVKDAASAGNLAGFEHEGRRFVSVVGDPAQEILLGKPVPDSQKPNRSLKQIWRHDDLHQAVRRGYHDRTWF
jgi:hypothetical protein